jgi:hypothetical protein
VSVQLRHSICNGMSIKDQMAMEFFQWPFSLSVKWR